MSATTMSAVALMALLPSLAMAGTPGEWRFQVLLDGRAIGTHVYTVDDRDGQADVHSRARFDVKFLVFDAYSYTHDAHERWQGNCLASLESKTDENGKYLAVRGTREGAHFEVEATRGNAELPGCVMSFAYWNPAMLGETKLLNAQTGEYVAVRIVPIAQESIEVRGKATIARHYALDAADFRIDLWYTVDGQWVQLESLTKSGRKLRYLIQ